MANDVLMTIAGADFSGSGYGKYQEIPDVRSSLYAAWLLGTDLDDTPGRDVTGNGRALVFTGGGTLTDPQITNAGGSGTNGTFNLAFAGGGGAGAAGTFTVAGGVVTAIVLTNPGNGYTSSPNVSLAACPGLAGATATVKRTGQGTKSYQFGAGIFGVAPFTGDAVAAANQEITLLSIARASFNAQTSLMGNYAGNAARGMLTGTIANGGSKAYLVEAAATQSGTLVDAQRATLWTLYASVFKRDGVQHFTWRTGLSQASAIVERTPAADIGGANAIRVGAQPTAFGTAAGAEETIAAVANKAWTQAEIANWGAAMSAKLLSYGINL